MTNIAKNTICLWYDDHAEEAARFYAQTFPIRRSAQYIAHLEIIRLVKKAMF